MKSGGDGRAFFRREGVNKKLVPHSLNVFHSREKKEGDERGRRESKEKIKIYKRNKGEVPVIKKERAETTCRREPQIFNANMEKKTCL